MERQRGFILITGLNGLVNKGWVISGKQKADWRKGYSARWEREGSGIGAESCGDLDQWRKAGEGNCLRNPGDGQKRSKATRRTDRRTDRQTKRRWLIPMDRPTDKTNTTFT